MCFCSSFVYYTLNLFVELIGSEEKCNLFIGDWVYDYEGEHLYTNSSCSFIEDHQNCMKNGRPDTDYLYWRWKPRDCELPRLDPLRFLEFMRNKSWAFIGDSISRNHVHSILCGLSMVIFQMKLLLVLICYHIHDFIHA